MLPTSVYSRFVKLFQLQMQSFSARGNVEIDIEENQDFSCFLNPANILNCSWSFQSLQRDAQLSVYIRYYVCLNEKSLCDLVQINIFRKQSSSNVLIVLSISVSLHAVFAMIKEQLIISAFCLRKELDQSLWL